MIIKDMFRKALGLGARFWQVVGPIVASESGKLLEQVLPIATQVVAEMATKRNLPNAKRDAALKEVRKRLVGSGVSVGTSVLNLAIELAVARAKTVGGNQQQEAR